MANPFGTGPFQPNPFGGPPGPQQPPPPPAPPRDEANVLATLSVVFAFVFAPAGLILGHLALAQIRHSGERGRDRALVGVTLSYVFITAAVIALIVAAIMPDSNPSRVALPTTTTAKPPPRTTTTPPPPTMAPADLDGLLASLDDIKNFTGDPALTGEATMNRPALSPEANTIDRPECWGAINNGMPNTYDLPAIVGYSESDFTDFHDLSKQWSAGQSVASFHDASVAQAQMSRVLSVWRQCGGSSLNETWHNGYTGSLSMLPPGDAGGGIMTMEVSGIAPPRFWTVRAIAAKANVFVDVVVTSTMSNDQSHHAALDITNFILNKIPG
ncbi:sensor domain-containing protein [Mycobacterium colombiense]